MTGDHVREKKDEHDREKKAREGDAREGDARRCNIDERVSLDGGGDPDGEGDRDRDQECRRTELGSRRKTLDDRLENALLGLERSAQISLQQMRDTRDVRHGECVVPSDFLAYCGADGGAT